MVIYDEVNILKQKEILSKIIDVNLDIKSEFEAHKLIQETMKNVKEEYNLDNYSLYTYIKDMTLIKWKNNANNKANHFTKVFYNELNYAKEVYGITCSELGFLLEISQYASWEANLLIDDEGKPMNQKALTKATGMDRVKIYRNTKSLEKKKCLLRIYDGVDVYYILNPNLFYKGKDINKNLPKIFQLIGYVSLNESNKNKREVKGKNDSIA